MSDETPGQVFEKLLAEWRWLEQAIICEFSSDFSGDELAADLVMERWRDRFRAAEHIGGISGADDAERKREVS